MSNSGDTADGLVERTGGTPVPPGTPPKVIPDLPPAKFHRPIRTPVIKYCYCKGHDDRLHALEKQVASLQSQVVDLRLAVKGLQ